jgi:predicted transcriptional regulator
LLDKGHVQAEKHGKAFIYQATTVQQEARSQALRSLLQRFFGGSPELLAQHLLNEQPLATDIQAQLQAKIDEAQLVNQANQANLGVDKTAVSARQDKH